jgi:hypothetical protein
MASASSLQACCVTVTAKVGRAGPEISNLLSKLGT